MSLWDEEDGFFYDVLRLPRRRAASAQGALAGRPDAAVRGRGRWSREMLDRLPRLQASGCEWFLEHRPDLARQRRAACASAAAATGACSRVVEREQLRRMLQRHARRERVPLAARHPLAVSKVHQRPPVRVSRRRAATTRVDYEPGESTTGLFGGNSNWRGPVWFPVNYLLIEALQQFHHYYGDDFKVECPTGSGKMMTLWEVAAELSQRLIAPLPARRRAAAARSTADRALFDSDPHWRDLLLFHEYFHGDNGARARRQPPDRLDGARRQAPAAIGSLIAHRGGARPLIAWW